MKKSGLLLIGGILFSVLLAGCTTKDTGTTTAAQPSTEVSAIETTAETFQPAPSSPETSAGFDVEVQLAEAEAQDAILTDKLMNDGSLTQADMNELAGQQYTLWDTLLNELWAELPHTLPEAQMQQLLQEERTWIRWKENSVALAADYYSGGSLSILAGDMRAAKLTRDRVYELAQILTSGQYPAVHTDTWLYEQVFLPYASNSQPTYENFLLLLEFRGLSPLEEEGVIQVQDPQFPDRYLCGSLSNESGVLTIPQLIYHIDDEASPRGVRVDFTATPPTYYIDAFFWDDGTEVDTLDKLADYLG